MTAHDEMIRSDNHVFISQLVALSFYSYIGESIRWVVGQIFGQACHNPGSISLNESEWMPCTTDPGSTSMSGGAMFIDMPANMLGCFLIGMFVSGDAVSQNEMPVAFLPQSHAFQKWSTTHLGLRTGLFGSLTTFASWNTQMVIMICGGNGTSTQWVSALFGYAVGWMAAMQSFLIGRDVAVALHRRNNPEVRRQADAHESRKSMLVQQKDLLPDMTTDYDSVGNDNDISYEEESKHEDQGIYLEKQTDTEDHRHHYFHKHAFTQKLREIQSMIHIRHERPRANLMESARNAGWHHHVKFHKLSHLRLYRMELFVNLVGFLSATALLIWGAVALSDKSDPSSITYRTYFIATLFSPFGTILRWQLSKLNGCIHNPKWEWLPIGTFAANMLASAISALMAALSLEINDELTLLLVVGAIKFGFAGCLSTVSTFVVETESLMKALPQHAHGYYYSLLTIGAAAILGVACYVWAVV